MVATTLIGQELHEPGPVGDRVHLQYWLNPGAKLV